MAANALIIELLSHIAWNFELSALKNIAVGPFVLLGCASGPRRRLVSVPLTPPAEIQSPVEREVGCAARLPVGGLVPQAGALGP